MSSKSYYVNGLLLGLYVMWWMCFNVMEENMSIISVAESCMWLLNVVFIYWKW